MDAVREHLERIASPRRRRDALTMVEVMKRATGEEPHLWKGIVGFGHYHYRYASGREGDAPAAGFAARSSAIVIYLSDGVGAHQELLDRLGPHTTGVACVYVKDVSALDLDVLEAMIARSYAALTAGAYTKRAREGGTG
jgi:hypothetical protein